MPIDPDSALASSQAIHTLAEHSEVAVNAGVVSFFAGLIGGSIAFLRSSQHHRILGGKALFVFYSSKVGLGCVAAYLAILVAPFFGLGNSVRAEEAIAILAATLGGEFIGVLLRRILGVQPGIDDNRQPEKRPGEDDGQQ